MSEIQNSQLSTLNSPLIPPGYKKTEVGVIPEDWDHITFGHLYAEPSRNGIYKTPEFQGHGTRIVNMGEMFGLEFISNQDMSRVRLTLRELSASKLQDGDLLFGRRSVVPAGAGKCSLVVSPSEPMTFESSIIRVRLDRMKILPRFYYYFFASSKGRSIVGIIVSGTNVKGIRASELRELKVPLPPLPEQRAIAEALSDADAFIESLEQLIAKKRHIKQGAMQELLTGKKRLPGFGGKWEVKALSDCLLTKPDYGINAPAVPFSDRLPTYIRISDISEHGQFVPDPRVSVKAPAADQFYLHEGDLVFARTGASVGKSYLYDSEDGLLVFAGFLIRIRPNPAALVPAFLAAYATTKPYWNWVRLMSMRSGQPGINGNEYAQLPIRLPPLPEQTAIAAILTDMDAEIAALEAKLAKARQIKQGMMRELLTGRIRLVNPVKS